MSDRKRDSATPPPPFRYAKHIFLAVSAVAFVALVLAGRAVLLPFLLAVLVAYVLFPAVVRVERVGMPRWTAILIVYAVTIGVVVGTGWLVVPKLFEETRSLIVELPALTERARNDYLPAVDARIAELLGHDTPQEAGPPAPSASPESLPPPPVEPAPIVVRPGPDGSYEIELRDDVHMRKTSEGTWVLGPPEEESTFSSERALQDALDAAVGYAQRNSLELLELGRKLVGGISRGIFYFFLTLMLAGYMMFTWEGIHRFVRDMWPRSRRPAFDRFLHRLDRGLAGVVRGQLLICVVNGVLSAIGFWFFDLKYWSILALVAGAMSIIPIFGSILSTIPAVAIGLTQSMGIAVGVLFWIVGIHQLEANFLNPKIIGDQAKIHPVLVVFSLLLGEHYFQITGALLAVPCLALVQAVFLHFRASVLKLPEPGEEEETPRTPPPGHDGEVMAVPVRSVAHQALALPYLPRGDDPESSFAPDSDAPPTDAPADTHLVPTRRSHDEPEGEEHETQSSPGVPPEASHAPSVSIEVEVEPPTPAEAARTEEAEGLPKDKSHLKRTLKSLGGG